MNSKITPGSPDPVSPSLTPTTKKEVSSGGHKITIGTHRPEPKKTDLVERKVFPPLPKIPGEETTHSHKEHHISKESPDKSDKVTHDALRGVEGKAQPKIVEKESSPQKKIEQRSQAPLIQEPIQKPLAPTREQKIANVLTEAISSGDVETVRKIANVLTEAISSGDVETVRKIATLAIGKNLAPVVTICLNSPNKENVQFLLVLKKVLVSGKQDTTKVDQSINQVLIQGFKKAIETNDTSLLRNLFSKAEKGNYDTQKLWESATTKLTNPVDVAFAQRIKDKFEGLQASAGKGEHTLNPFQMFKICVVAEFKLQAGGPENQAVYLKKTKEGLGASLLIDHQQKTYTILSKESIAEGGAGKVKKAVEVAERTLQGVETVAVTAVIRKVNLDGVEMSPQEIGYEKKYGGLKSYATYTKGDATYTKGDAEKTTFTAKQYAGDTVNLPKEISNSGRCNILCDAAVKLATMHNDGVVHRDVKPGNILFATEDGETHGNLIDFGMCFEPASKDETKSEVTGFPSLYGTPQYTAPEVLLAPDKHTSLDARQAQDAFAFGCTAYELLCQKQSSWGRSIAPGLQPGFKQMIVQAMGKARDNLLKEIETGSLSQEQKAQYQIVYKLLDPNPDTRMKIHEFLAEIAPHTSSPSAAINIPPPPAKTAEKSPLDEVLTAAINDLEPASKEKLGAKLMDYKQNPTANDLDDFVKMMGGG